MDRIAGQRGLRSLVGLLDRVPLPGLEALVVIWFVCAAAMCPARGRYDLRAILIVALAGVAFATAGFAGRRWTWLAGRQGDQAHLLRLLLLVACSVLCVLAAVLSPLVFVERPAVERLMTGLQLTVGIVLACLAYRCWRAPLAPEWLTVWVVACAVVLLGVRALVLLASPAPWCDAWTLQQEAATVFAAGSNPYAHEYHQPFPFALFGYRSHFGYLPLVLLWGTPFAVLLGDIRLGYVTADVLTVWLLYRIACGRSKEPWRRSAAALASLAYLANPLGPAVLEQGSCESLLVLFSSLAVLAVGRSSAAAGVAVGLAAVAKQTNLLLFPLSLATSRRRWSSAAWAIGCGAGLLLLFFLWDPGAFLKSTVANLLPIPARRDAFSLWTVVYRTTGMRIPDLVTAGAVAGCWLVALAFAFRSRPQATLIAIALSFWALFMTARQSFFNYYFFLLALCCLVLADGIARLPFTPGRCRHLEDGAGSRQRGMPAE